MGKNITFISNEEKMNTTNYLYLIKQNINNEYDTYESVVVCAQNASEARRIHPSGLLWHEDKCVWYDNSNNGLKKYESGFIKDWCESIKDVEVIYLGVANNTINLGVVCSSRN